MAISVVVFVIDTVIPPHSRTLLTYLITPLVPGFLLIHALALPMNGPPVGIIFLIIWGFLPIVSGSLVYGFLVYLILRLRIELRKGKTI